MIHFLHIYPGVNVAYKGDCPCPPIGYSSFLTHLSLSLSLSLRSRVPACVCVCVCECVSLPSPVDNNSVLECRGRGSRGRGGRDLLK